MPAITFDLAAIQNLTKFHVYAHFRDTSQLKSYIDHDTIMPLYTMQVAGWKQKANSNIFEAMDASSESTTTVIWCLTDMIVSGEKRFIR